jgi:hypothetical protein
MPALLRRHDGPLTQLIDLLKDGGALSFRRGQGGGLLRIGPLVGRDQLEDFDQLAAGLLEPLALVRFDLFQRLRPVSAAAEDGIGEQLRRPVKAVIPPESVQIDLRHRVDGR